MTREEGAMTGYKHTRANAALIVLMLSLIGCADGEDTATALRSFACLPSADIKVVCGLQNPEDLVLYDDDGGWLLISQMSGGDFASAPGSLIAWQPESGRRQRLWPPEAQTLSDAIRDEAHWGDPTCPQPAQFSPHGIDLGTRPDGASVLLVVNHRAEGVASIEFFALQSVADAPQLEWRGCVMAVPGAVMNDVVAAGNGFIASRMYSVPMPAWRGFLMATMRLNTGSVHEWQPAEGWREIPNSAGALPNGLALSSNGQTLFVHQYFDQQLLKLNRLSGELLGSLPIVHGDNLSWTADGSLLSASHPAGLEEMSICHELENGACLSDMLIQRIEPQSLRITHAFHHRGEPFGMATVAVERGGEIYVGSFRADRIAHFPVERLQAVEP